MLEGGDRRGLRRVDAWEEETRAGRGRDSGEGGLPGEDGLRCREGRASGRQVSGLKTLGSRRGAWRSRWSAGRGPWTDDRPGMADRRLG